MAQVQLKDITKIYDNSIRAVDDINLKVADKEFIVIVGPSGCGKTTTLRMIAGLDDITSGTVSIDGRVVNDNPPKDRDIAMVFQNYALYPHMTVYQNMAFALKLKKASNAHIKQRVSEVAEMLEIADILKRKPRALSGGQRQRVALAKAIVRKPSVFLFDEPLSNLDAKLRITTRAEIKALHQKLQTTSIYVTHDQAEAMTLGDRVCVMYDGKIQQIATPMEVYEKPVNRFVAGFVGAPGMNFFDGEVQVTDKGSSFVLPDDTSIDISELGSNLKQYDQRKMVLGIRPEHLSLGESAQDNKNIIPAVVELVELLGDRKEVFLTASTGAKFTAVVNSHVNIKAGLNVSMKFKPALAHVFEPSETGLNVSLK